jgi:hypothetical protein
VDRFVECVEQNLASSAFEIRHASTLLVCQSIDHDQIEKAASYGQVSDVCATTARQGHAKHDPEREA